MHALWDFQMCCSVVLFKITELSIEKLGNVAVKVQLLLCLSIIIVGDLVIN